MRKLTRWSRRNSGGALSPSPKLPPKLPRLLCKLKLKFSRKINRKGNNVSNARKVNRRVKVVNVSRSRRVSNSRVRNVSRSLKVSNSRVNVSRKLNNLSRKLKRKVNSRVRNVSNRKRKLNSLSRKLNSLSRRSPRRKLSLSPPINRKSTPSRNLNPSRKVSRNLSRKLKRKVSRLRAVKIVGRNRVRRKLVPNAKIAPNVAKTVPNGKTIAAGNRILADAPNVARKLAGRKLGRTIALRRTIVRNAATVNLKIAANINVTKAATKMLGVAIAVKPPPTLKRPPKLKPRSRAKSPVHRAPHVRNVPRRKSSTKLKLPVRRTSKLARVSRSKTLPAR